MSVWLFGANFYPLWAKSGAKLHSNAPASYPLCWHCGILPLMGGGWVTQCAVFAPSLPRPKYGGMQVWCKYGASMTQVWCRALAGADRMDRGIMQTCPVLPVPCITAMQCCIVHCALCIVALHCALVSCHILPLDHTDQHSFALNCTLLNRCAVCTTEWRLWYVYSST